MRLDTRGHQRAFHMRERGIERWPVSLVCPPAFLQWHIVRVATQPVALWFDLLLNYFGKSARDRAQLRLGLDITQVNRAPLTAVSRVLIQVFPNNIRKDSTV